MMFKAVSFVAVAVAAASLSSALPTTSIAPGAVVEFQFAKDTSQCIGLFDDDSPDFVLASCATFPFGVNFTLVAGSDAPGVITHEAADDDGNFHGPECILAFGLGEVPGSTGCSADGSGANSREIWTYHSSNGSVSSAEGGCWTVADDESIIVQTCGADASNQKFNAVPVAN